MLEDLVALFTAQEYINTKSLVQARTVDDLQRAWVGNRGPIVFELLFFFDHHF